MTASKTADPHIAHEDHSNDGPVGGVPDEQDVGKTATPDGEAWVDAGGAYGGLRTRVPEPAEKAQTPIDAPITVSPLPAH